MAWILSIKLPQCRPAPMTGQMENIFLTIEMEEMDRDKIVEIYDFKYPEVHAGLIHENPGYRVKGIIGTINW
jgi:hypothetical protein